MIRNNEVLNLIKEIDISKYSQKEYREIVDSIVDVGRRECGENNMKDELILLAESFNLLNGFWVFTDTGKGQTFKDAIHSLESLSKRIDKFLFRNNDIFLKAKKKLERVVNNGK